MKSLALMLMLCFISLGFAQLDLIEYLEDDKRLIYIMDYERLETFAEEKNCNQRSFELGLVNTAARTLLLYLPFEAEFYNEVNIIEVRAMREGDIILLMQAPLRDIKAGMNARFRATVQGYASARAGHCFALTEEVMQPWLNVIEARGGSIQVDPQLFALQLEQASPINVSSLSTEAASLESSEESTPVTSSVTEAADTAADTAVEAAVEAMVVDAGADSTGADAVQDIVQTETDEQTIAEASPQSTGIVLEYFIPDGYSLTPFLSEERITTFARADASIQANVDYLAILETSKGLMILDLDEVNAPRTVNNFIFLARHHFYDGVLFHRVIPGFMAQTGDPSGTGRGGPGYQFADEFSNRLRHNEKGIVSMANSGPDTNGSQFFITFNATPWLNDQHSIFGRLLIGYDVLESINTIDPEEPSVIVPAISTLAEIATEGIVLAGDGEAAILGYLREHFGAVPNIGETFTIDGYQGVLGINPETGAPLVGFWKQPDTINRLYIVEREGL